MTSRSSAFYIERNKTPPHLHNYVALCVCVCLQSDTVCVGVREDRSEAGSEGVVETRYEQFGEDHRPASRQRQHRKILHF